MKNRYCRTLRLRWMKNVNNLAEAKAKCFDDQNCGMFTDLSNKGTSFYSCPFTTERNFGILKRSTKSVVYAKGKMYSCDEYLTINSLYKIGVIYFNLYNIILKILAKHRIALCMAKHAIKG